MDITWIYKILIFCIGKICEYSMYVYTGHGRVCYAIHRNGTTAVTVKTARYVIISNDNPRVLLTTRWPAYTERQVSAVRIPHGAFRKKQRRVRSSLSTRPARRCRVKSAQSPHRPKRCGGGCPCTGRTKWSKRENRNRTLW